MKLVIEYDDKSGKLDLQSHYKDGLVCTESVDTVPAISNMGGKMYLAFFNLVNNSNR